MSKCKIIERSEIRTELLTMKMGQTHVFYAPSPPQSPRKIEVAHAAAGSAPERFHSIEYRETHLSKAFSKTGNYFKYKR